MIDRMFPVIEVEGNAGFGRSCQGVRLPVIVVHGIRQVIIWMDLSPINGIDHLVEEIRFKSFGVLDEKDLMTAAGQDRVILAQGVPDLL